MVFKSPIHNLEYKTLSAVHFRRLFTPADSTSSLFIQKRKSFNSQPNLHPKPHTHILPTSFTMYASSILLALTAASSVYATCFTGGENWASQKALALRGAANVCSTFAEKTWYPGDSLGGCFDLDSNKKADFVLELIGDVAYRTITADECYDGFQKEINGCDNGGSTAYTNWKYTLVAPPLLMFSN